MNKGLGGVTGKRASTDALVTEPAVGAYSDRSSTAGPHSMKLSEADIERTCTDFLALDGWRALKTDPVSRREWGKGFGEKGMADRLYIRYRGLGDPTLGVLEPAGRRLAVQCDVMWIEWKRLGGKAKQHQLDWHTHERKLGALTLIAGEDFPASIEGFQQWYRYSGLQRRQCSSATAEG